MRNESSEACTTNEKQWVQGRYKIWETRALRPLQPMRNNGCKVAIKYEKRELWGSYNQWETRGTRPVQPMRNKGSEACATEWETRTPRSVRLMRNKNCEVCTTNKKQGVWDLRNQWETIGPKSIQLMRNNGSKPVQQISYKKGGRGQTWATSEKQRYKNGIRNSVIIPLLSRFLFICLFWYHCFPFVITRLF